MKITASLVLYSNRQAVFEEAIRSVVESEVDILSILDNSPTPLTSKLFEHPRVRYDYAGENLGFGAGHNRAFASVADRSDVHFIINPDVSFGPGVVGKLAGVFMQDPAVMAAMPAIYDEAGRQQHLCKELPTPIHLIVRRFIPVAAVRRRIDESYEFRHLPSEGLVDIPSLSGCFLAVRATALTRIEGFDEGYFMYMEDVDLVRRLGDLGRTVFVPGVAIRHGHARGSYRVGKLMLVHIQSALRYFRKWGWLHDPVRRLRNAAARRAVVGRINT